MSKKGFVKLSDEELIKKITKREHIEIRLKSIAVYALIIGLVGAIIFKLVGIETLMTILLFLSCLGLVLLAVGIFLGKKTRSMVDDQLDDFYEAMLQNAFGSRMNTSEMRIGSQLIKKLRPIDVRWDECDVHRFYEGNYHGTHFSAANVG